MVRRVLACIAIALAISCTSPTLPLPPPLLPSIGTSSVAGMVHLSSTNGAEPSAILVIFNRNPNVPRDQRVSATQADEVGTWAADVVASPGDVLDVSQEYGTAHSAPVTVQVPR